MDLEDLFDHKERRRRSRDLDGEHRARRERERDDDRRRPYSDHRRQDDSGLLFIGRHLLANRKLLIAVAVAGILLLLVAALLILPLLGNALDYIDQTGGVKGLLERIWQGSGSSGTAPVPNEYVTDPFDARLTEVG